MTHIPVTRDNGAGDRRGVVSAPLRRRNLRHRRARCVRRRDVFSARRQTVSVVPLYPQGPRDLPRRDASGDRGRDGRYRVRRFPDHGTRPGRTGATLVPRYAVQGASSGYRTRDTWQSGGGKAGGAKIIRASPFFRLTHTKILRMLGLPKQTSPKEITP